MQADRPVAKEAIACHYSGEMEEVKRERPSFWDISSVERVDCCTFSSLITDVYLLIITLNFFLEQITALYGLVYLLTWAKNSVYQLTLLT